MWTLTSDFEARCLISFNQDQNLYVNFFITVVSILG